MEEEKNVEVLNVDDSNPFEETMISEKNAFVKDWDKDDNDKEYKSEDINVPKKRKKKGLVIFLLVIIFIALLGILSYFFYFGNSKRLINTSINNVSKKFDKVLSKNIDKLDVGGKSTLTSDISFDIDKLDELKFLNELKTKIVINSDKEENKLLSNLEITFKNDSLFSGKYFIDKDKEYYYTKDLIDNYVINDNKIGIDINENLDDRKEDIKYLNKIITNSFANSLKDKYFSKDNVTTRINGKNKSVTKVTLKIDNENANEIINVIIKDLEKDKKAISILEKYNIKINDLKIDKDDKIFNDKGIEYNTYVDKLTFKEYKCELVIDGDKITYEDNKRDRVEIYSDNKLLSSVVIDKDTSFTIYDENDKKIGTVAIINEKLKTSIVGEIDYNNISLNINLDSMANELSKDDKYYITTKLIIEATTNNDEIFKITSNIDSTLVGDVKIDEDVSKAVKSDTITDEQKEKFSNKLLEKLSKIFE